MKRVLIKTLFQTALILVLHGLLLRFMADRNIIAGVFCPGPHLPFYTLPLIVLFMVVRIYVIFLPGVILSRIGIGFLKLRAATHKYTDDP